MFTKKITNKKNKKAIFFTIDALLASVLLLSTVVLIVYNSHFEDTPIAQQTYITQDTLKVLSELRIGELNNTFISQEISDGNITDLNKTVIDQVGEYWALNETDKAQRLLDIVLNDSLNYNFGIHISIDDQTLLLSDTERKNNIATMNRMISGIEQGKPLTGASGTSYLKKIHNKKTSSYTYFGGFIGEGNITVVMTLPVDFNSSRMLFAQLKIETPGAFLLFINNHQCNSIYNGSAGMGMNDSITSLVSSWDIISCNDSFVSGTNNITLNYVSSLNTSYISGGFLKISYTTDRLTENTVAGYERYYFPDINGFINMYDTLSVQGNIKNWTLNVTFFNSYQTQFTLGNETIFVTQGNSTHNQSIFYLRASQDLPQEPIPLRFSVTNFSNLSTTIYGLPADALLITDVSGSMADCVGTDRDCRYSHRPNKHATWVSVTCTLASGDSCANDYCNTGDALTKNHREICVQTKLDVAKTAANTFVDTIFVASLSHKIGLLDFDTESNTLVNLTSTAAILHSAINNYVTGGATCTCCALNRARNNIITSENNRYLILLSDGEPNICCTSLNDGVGTGASSGCGADANNPINWSILAGQTACNNNITVFTIGFGAEMSAAGQDTMRQIACNSSLYYNATNTSQLESIFTNISKQISLAANYSSQTVTVLGNFTASRLFGNSYIDIYYEPIVENATQNKISLVKETAQFNSCNASIFLPSNIAIQDAFVTSYSSNHWTKTVQVNNVLIFNLTKYGTNYALLGDPFIIQIPSVALIPGIYNNISLVIGDSATNNSNCSHNNTLIYTALINVSTKRTNALNSMQGCKWTIRSTTETVFNVTIPKDYSGNNTCSYNGASISYNPDDVYDVAVYNVLKQSDYENNGKIFFDIDQNDLEIILITTGDVAYMCGPSLMKVDVWQ